MLIAALVSAQLFCMCTAAFLIFPMNGNTFSESASYAIITVFMLLSFVRQVSFIIGSPVAAAFLEIFLFIGSMVLILSVIFTWYR